MRVDWRKSEEVSGCVGHSPFPRFFVALRCAGKSEEENWLRYSTLASLDFTMTYEFQSF